MVGYLLTKAPQERRTVVQVAVLGGAVVVLAAATLFKTVQLNG